MLPPQPVPPQQQQQAYPAQPPQAPQQPQPQPPLPPQPQPPQQQLPNLALAPAPQQQLPGANIAANLPNLGGNLGGVPLMPLVGVGTSAGGGAISGVGGAISGVGGAISYQQGVPQYNSIPMATVANVNGVPQLVAVVPQYVLPAGVVQQPMALQPPMPGAPMGAPAQMAAQMQPPPSYPLPPASQPHGAQRGRDGGAKGSGEGELRSKRLTFRGREMRSVDDASEAGCVRELAHDQNGCRFLQDQLELRNPAHVDIVFDAVHADAVALSVDPFGNYLVQKLVQYGSDEQRGTLLGVCADQLVPIALNVHGTRVVQKMVECASNAAQKSALAAALRDRIMELVRDMNGNHVVQRCLASMTTAEASFIFDRVAADCLLTATHRHG